MQQDWKTAMFERYKRILETQVKDVQSHLDEVVQNTLKPDKNAWAEKYTRITELQSELDGVSRCPEFFLEIYNIYVLTLYKYKM